VGLIRSISHILAAVFSNGSDFNRQWSRDDSQTDAGDGLPRRWQGQWISETNGHHGALRCLLAHDSPTEYVATFYAIYAGVLRVCYSVALRGQRNGETLKLEGDADLGRLGGGTYHYAGEATASEFSCSYECKYDRGTFEMSPAPRNTQDGLAAKNAKITKNIKK
jgi:hypothetical protein